MAKQLQEYEDMDKHMKKKICQLKDLVKEQEVGSKTLEDFKTYALKIQCDLSNVYMKILFENNRDT